MRRTCSIIRKLRLRDEIFVLALFAMFWQVLFTAAHLSAMATAAALGGPTGERLGFLQICTAEGLATINLSEVDGDHQPRSSSNGAISCLLCGTAAVDTVTGAIDAGFLPATSHLLQAGERPDASSLTIIGAPQRVGTNRGPPASSIG
jgi:hypothetical protein